VALISILVLSQTPVYTVRSDTGLVYVQYASVSFHSICFATGGWPGWVDLDTFICQSFIPVL